MKRLLYEKSVPHRGYLIIPFVYETVSGEAIYSFQLLAEIGHRGAFHQSNNPAGLYSSDVSAVIQIAKDYLDRHSDISSSTNHFQHRYTYRHNLIIVYQEAGKFFYDHYPPQSLTNLAAPKIFTTEQDCLSWIQQGIDRLHSASTSDH